MYTLQLGIVFYECTLGQVAKHRVSVSLLIWGVNMYYQFNIPV